MEKMTKHDINLTYYQNCKRLHKCVRCGTQDARTLNNKPLCFECLEKKRIEMKGKDQRSSNAKSYAKASENGICIHCKKRKTTPGYKQCDICRADARLKYRMKHPVLRSEAAEYNLCTICLTKPRYNDNNTCYDCYQYVVNKFKGTNDNSKIKSSMQVVFNKEWYSENNEIHLYT